jgi:tRNA-specific 2-thiouridylase
LPIGDYTKKEVREIARELKLSVSEKPESMEICFVPDNDYGSFLRDNYKGKFKSGPILNISGKTIGTHGGITNYTIGQRKGIGIAQKKPIYVLKINAKENSITVGEEKHLYSRKLTGRDINFVSTDKLKKPMPVTVKIRSMMPPQPAVIKSSKNDKILVEFKKPQRAITPGQAVVFYDRDKVLGGATIESSV